LSSSSRSEIEKPPTDGHQVARPWWLGILVVLLGGVWLYGAASLPQTAQYARIGPGLSLTVIGGALVLLGALLLLQIAQGEEFSAQEAEDAVADAAADWPAFFTAVAAIALPLIAIRHLGFPLTAALSFALIARAFGSRRTIMDLAIGAALSIAAYFAFAGLGVTLGGFLPLVTGR
jgi:putative tricarboxylic transport membrane protein